MSDKFQIEMISLEELVSLDSDYRKFVKLFNFKKIEYRLKKLEKTLGRTGYGMVRLFKCLLYQFMEDLSDRDGFKKHISVDSKELLSALL